MINKKSKIFLTGHKGLVGSEILRKLIQNGYTNILTIDRKKLDLTNQQKVFNFIKKNKPKYIIIAAARVGGIKANVKYPAEFLFQNMAIQNNLIHGAYLNKIKNIIFLGSSCIYPKNCKQPMKESFLMLGKPEETNLSYAIAKIAGIKLCESYNREYGNDFRSIMPTNLYGPGDNFHPKNSHVIASLIHRFHNAKVSKKRNIVVWGTGKPFREFLHVDDMSHAAIHVMNLDKSIYIDKTKPQLSHINVGSGEECSISDLAEMIAEVTDFQGNIEFDASKPDGTPRKLIDSSLLRSMGWEPALDLRKGLIDTYNWYLKNIA